MLVPQYWAEARLQHRARGKQVTVRRFGWSDVSVADAQTLADARAQEAMQRILAGEPLKRREPKRAYNGAEGVPIREQVVAREGSTVITRNSYGARCLNTPDVLFADLDFPEGPGGRLVAVVAVSLLLLVPLAWRFSSCLAIALVPTALILSAFIARLVFRTLQALGGGPEAQARARIDAFLHKHPDWHLRIYRTPAGLRVLALHRTFDPAEPQVLACFKALGVDRVYAAMCLRQHCFRARVSAKPWRIGITTRRPPRRRAWPFEGEVLARYEAWVARYEAVAEGYAACRLLGSAGSGTVHPEAARVQQLHDTLSRAESTLSIA